MQKQPPRKRSRKPVLEQLEGLDDAAWTGIGKEEEAIFAAHRPSGWDREQHYVVVRRRSVDGQGLLIPHHTAILVSRNDLPLAELVARHRGKQGQENAFKGPLRDMDLHHPPCRGYRANQAFYALGQIAQALLRAAALMTRSARKLCLRFAKTNFRLDWLYGAMVSLEARAPPAAA